MSRTLLKATAAALVAGALLLACTSGAGADGDTIEACQDWQDLRDGGSLLGEGPRVVEIAEKAQDAAVREAADDLANSLALNLQSALWPTRARALDRACSDALRDDAAP